MTHPLRLLPVALLALGLAACSQTGGEGSEGMGEGREGSEGGEESATQYTKSQTFDMVRNGAHLIVSYDPGTQMFTGTVTNATSSTLTRVRIEIHLDNGVELGPTTPVDLGPGQTIPVTLDATGQDFQTWGAHPETGGGGDSSNAALDPGSVRTLTGLSAPAETAATQQARQTGIHDRSDSLLRSTAHYTVETAAGTLRFRQLADCSGTGCDLLDPTTGETDTVSLGRPTIAPVTAQALGSAHGITLVDESGSYENVDATSLGAWMDHSAFLVHSDRIASSEVDSHALYSLASGDLTGQPLTGSATWLGLMVGAPVSGEDEGDRLIGTAALNYDPASGGLDAAFSGIKNIDHGTAHTSGTVIFSNLTVEADGTFARGQSGARINGGFYGPGHAEAAGIFEQSDIVGAFGAKKQ